MFYRFAVFAALVVVTSIGAAADGILLPVERPNTTIVVPDQLFTVKYHHVDVSIQDQLCQTKIDQVFHNDYSVEREGMYVFPMPEGSAITRFSMFAGEQEIRGKILDKDEARSIYESIVRQRKDPALLEYIDRNTFRARVYPIHANGDKRIRLDYSEVAVKSGDAFRYVYPLSTERFSARPLEDCRVTIKITSKKPITSVYSPTHTIDVERTGDRTATVKWSARNTRPNTDLILYYTVSDDDIGMDLVAHRLGGQKGYYMLLAAPRVDIDRTKIQTKNVVFVMDRTGSMSGEKIVQAKAAMKFCLNSLRPNDRFNVITFSASPELVFERMRTASAEAKREALDAVEEVEATGGTNIDSALDRAFAQFSGGGSIRNYIIFITDGLPTMGEISPEKILKNAQAGNKNKVKTFAFGVGYDVNTHLLDKLCEQNKGEADYVRPREDIEEKVGSFFAKVSDPILTDVKLKITGVSVSDSYPYDDMPDLFTGSQVVVFGRYTGSGRMRVELSGIANGARKSFVLESALPESDEGNRFIPQLWASRKIGYLLDEIRLHQNQELIDEVVRLSKEYGIPTEFTSFFADDRQVADLSGLRSRVTPMINSAGASQSGSHSVAQSQNARMMRKQGQLPQAYENAEGFGDSSQTVVGALAPNHRTGGVFYDSQDRAVVVANVQNVEGRTFYQRGAFWEDANDKDKQDFIQIKQFSDAHFKLLKAHPTLAQYSTLGNARIVLDNNQAIEIGPEGREQLSDAEVRDLLRTAAVEGKSSGSSSRGPWVVAVLLVMGISIPASRRMRLHD